MKVLVQPRHEDAGLGAILRDDGWAVKVGPDGVLSATHPDVPDEEAARGRLEALGLLTSPSVSIEFPPTDG
jgi:hypothetical protein